MTSEDVYKYIVSMKFINKDEEIAIPTESINLIVIDYNYTTSYSPILLMEVNMDLSIYNTMIKNKTTGKVLLDIGMTKEDNAYATINYIKKQLSYFFTSNNIDTETSADPETTSNAYKRVYMGLTDDDVINRDKIIANGIFKNANMESIVNKFMNFNLVKEPFDYNPDFDTFIIPPLESISALLKYLNSRSSFYKTGYRYFNDYKKGYLLSNKGNGISIGDGKYSSVKINVTSQRSTTDDSNLQGMVIDNTQHLYNIQVNSNKFNLMKNEKTDNIYNQFYGVDSDGNTKKVDVVVNQTDSSKLKAKMVRVTDNNLNYLDCLKNEVELTACIINISKADIDNSVIEPHKQFSITLPKEYIQYNGKYILINKKESYVRDGDNFECAVLATFEKVTS